ncbi:MAG: cobalamin-binding protein [Deltaproteobacteria bacterium]|nr:cobalamin-binding protein [Candidatus Tharpella aukensis]
MRSILRHILILLISILLLPITASALTVVDESGTTVEIPDRVQRILPLTPSLAEILFALGLDQRIVGVTDFATYPKAARKKPRVGTFINPSLEKILALEPDLVIVGSERQDEKTNAALKNFSIPVYRIRPVDLNTIYRSISNLGEITGTLPQAQKVIIEMKKKVAAVERRVARLPKKRVFYQVGIDPIVSVNRQTFAADLIRRAGGILVTVDNPVRYPRYSIERVIVDAPEVIIISSMSPNTNYQRFRANWQRWRSIPAVRQGQIYVIDSDMVDRPAPRIVDGLAQLSEFIHPSKQR